ASTFVISHNSFVFYFTYFFFSSRRRHTRSKRDWSSDVCSSDLLWRRLEQGRQFSKDSEVSRSRSGFRRRRRTGRRRRPHQQCRRSEERRVGKECRSGGGRYDQNKTSESYVTNAKPDDRS